MKKLIGTLRATLFLLAALLLISGISAEAQTFRGTILGTVMDSSGLPVTGATVAVKNRETGLARTTQTSEDGSYTVTELPIGTYTVTISQSGFQTSVTSDVVVNVAGERRVDVALKPGQVSELVEVSGEELPQVETTTNEMGGVLTSQTIQDIPVNGRDYTKLIYLNPGVAGSPDQISDSPGSFGEFSMNGARGRSNNYLLDGTDMNDGYRNDPAINEAGVFGTPATILPIDAVAEVRVISNFEPEYGRNAGAVVNIVTKSGTNTFHGSAAEYFRNSALDARNYFNPVKNANGTPNPKAPFHNNQYGGSLGGPIIKDKTFFFLDYEGQQEPVGVVTLASVPTGSAPDGSLSPSDATNPVISQLLARHPWPAPNLGGGTASVVSPSFNRLSSLIAKIDHSFNANNLLTGRYFFGDSVQSFPLALTATGGQLPGFNTFTPTRVQLVSLSYVHTIGSNKVNELRFGWNRFAEGFFPQDQSFQPSSIGLNTGPSDSGLPIILVSGVAQLGATSSVPRHRVDSNSQVLDNFSWKINKHDLKFGVDFHRTSIQQYFNKYFRGRRDSRTLSTTMGTWLPPPSKIFSQAMLTDGFQYFGDSTRHTFENNFGFYVQDSYRINAAIDAELWNALGLFRRDWREKQLDEQHYQRLAGDGHGNLHFDSGGAARIEQLVQPGQERTLRRAPASRGTSLAEGRPWCAPGTEYSSTPSRRTWSWDTCLTRPSSTPVRRTTTSGPPRFYRPAQSGERSSPAARSLRRQRLAILSAMFSASTATSRHRTWKTTI